MTILERAARAFLIIVCLLAGWGDAQAQSETCRLFPGEAGFWTAHAHVAVSQAGGLSAQRDLAFTPCREVGEWISRAPFAGGGGEAGGRTELRFTLTAFAGWATIAQHLRRACFLADDALPGLDALGLARTSDAQALLDELVERFGVVATAPSRREPRDRRDRLAPHDLASVVAARGGNSRTLTFALLNLLRYNGIDAELVLVMATTDIDLGDAFSLAQVEHVLVYAPALDRYLDPTNSEVLTVLRRTLPGVTMDFVARSRNELLMKKARIHVAGPSRVQGGQASPNACSDYCLRPAIAGDDPPVAKVKTERIFLPRADAP